MNLLEMTAAEIKAAVQERDAIDAASKTETAAIFDRMFQQGIL